MKKYVNVKYLVLVLVCVPIVFIVYGCYSFFSAFEIYEDGYFRYSVGDGQVCITELTADGKAQAVLVVPEKINGYRVTALGRWGLGGRFFDGEGGNLTKLFCPFYLTDASASFENCPNLRKIFIIAITPPFNMMFNTSVEKYVPGYLAADVEGQGTYYDKYYLSNVSYMYNYDGAPNAGYYWIDDYDYGDKIDWQPYLPEREGYRFTGWYKEPECVHKWDFEKDILPEKLTEKETPLTDKPAVEEKENIIYQETRLYADWIK